MMVDRFLVHLGFSEAFAQSKKEQGSIGLSHILPQKEFRRRSKAKVTEGIETLSLFFIFIFISFERPRQVCSASFSLAQRLMEGRRGKGACAY